MTIELLQKIRQEIYWKMQRINEDRLEIGYPKEFIDGFVLGSESSIREIDKELNKLYSENEED